MKSLNKNKNKNEKNIKIYKYISYKYTSI